MVINNQKRKKLLKSVEIIFLIIVIAVFILTIYVSVYQLFTSTGSLSVEYEGKIVDKTITFHHWLEGSEQVRRLHIKPRDSEIIKIAVTTELYDRARVGMWIKSERGKQVRLSRQEFK